MGKFSIIIIQIVFYFVFCNYEISNTVYYYFDFPFKGSSNYFKKDKHIVAIGKIRWLRNLILFIKGAYDDEKAAAHAYDLAALKYWGQNIILNFSVI